LLVYLEALILLEILPLRNKQHALFICGGYNRLQLSAINGGRGGRVILKDGRMGYLRLSMGTSCCGCACIWVEVHHCAHVHGERPR